MRKNLYEINLKEFRDNYECGDFAMLEYIKDYLSDDLQNLYDDVINYNEIYANDWTINDLFNMGKEDKYWIDRANNFITKYNIPKDDYNEFGKYFEKYIELRNTLLNELGLDDRYLDQDKSVDDIPENGFYESEIITNSKDVREGYSYTIARVGNFGYCTELHYCDGEATVEYGYKINHNYWEKYVEDANWFNINMSENQITEKLWELFDNCFGIDNGNEL